RRHWIWREGRLASAHSGQQVRTLFRIRVTKCDRQDLPVGVQLRRRVGEIDAAGTRKVVATQIDGAEMPHTRGLVIAEVGRSTDRQRVRGTERRAIGEVGDQARKEVLVPQILKTARPIATEALWEHRLTEGDGQRVPRFGLAVSPTTVRELEAH